MPSPKIVVTGRLPEPALELLRGAGSVWAPEEDGPLESEALRAAVRGAAGVVTLLYDRVDEALLDAAGPQLRVVANVAVGYDNVDVRACVARGVAVTNTPGVLTEATADLAFALLLAVSRRLGEGERLVRAGTPWSWSLDFHLGTGIQGRTLGVVGLGQIGRALARRAIVSGMSIAYTGPRRADPGVESALGARYLSFPELLAAADVVSLHCPLNDETRHLIDADALARMQSSSYLVNTSRGPVVDEEALVRALQEGAIAGAALDVFEREPAVHPELLAQENVVLLPHLGSATRETRTAMAMLAARNAVAVLRGEEPLTPV